MASDQPSCSHHHHHHHHHHRDHHHHFEAGRSQEEENIWGAHLNDFTKIRIACIDAKFCFALKSWNLSNLGLRLSGNDLWTSPIRGLLKNIGSLKLVNLSSGCCSSWSSCLLVDAFPLLLLLVCALAPFCRRTCRLSYLSHPPYLNDLVQLAFYDCF